MRLVMLITMAGFLSFGAAAQKAADRDGKEIIVKAGKKGKKQKFPVKEAVDAKPAEEVTLTDEREYKAKSRFEQLLLRRLEIDAAEGERQRAQQKN